MCVCFLFFSVLSGESHQQFTLLFILMTFLSLPHKHIFRITLDYLLSKGANSTNYHFPRDPTYYYIYWSTFDNLKNITNAQECDYSLIPCYNIKNFKFYKGGTILSNFLHLGQFFVLQKIKSLIQVAWVLFRFKIEKKNTPLFIESAENN